MSQQLNHDGSITVTAYSLPEFTFEIAYLGAKGFTPSMLNSHCPTGGMGSTYQAILVPLTSYYIALDGTHINVPKQDDVVATATVSTKIVEEKTTNKRTTTKKTV